MSKSDPIPVDIDINSIMAKIARYESRLAISNAKTKASLFAALEAAGVTRITVVFDGAGDSGGVEDVRVDGDVDSLPAVQVTFFEAGYNDDDAKTARDRLLKDAVETLAMSFLSQTHGGLENNDGGFGEVIFDVAAGTATLDYNERFTETENHQHEF
jgi:hypothetical protein